MARRRWGGWVSVRMLRALGQGVRVHAAAGARTVASPVFSAGGGLVSWRRRFASGIACCILSRGVTTPGMTM